MAILSVTSHGFSLRSLNAIVSSLFLCIALFFFDDAYDYKSDLLIHPHRPIPMGLISIRQVYLSGVVSFIIGMLVALTLPLYQFVIFLTAAVIGVVIVFGRLESILRTAFISFLIGVLPSFSSFPDLKGLLFGLIMALPHVGGSITKDFIHSVGDRIGGLNPPPEWAKYLASSAFFLSSVILWLPKVLNLVTWLYIPPIVFTHVSCIILGINVLRGHYQRVYIWGGIGMCSSLIAFLLGGIH
ncbi:MAG: UbiA family prenyltransferase [Candidatus Bathyarchaeia archaeon]